MMLLDANKNLEFGGITITDWIQAIGALIAIIAAIIGFIQLLIKDKDKQKQIDSLKLLAQQSVNQSEQLSAQVDQMIEGNRLQTEYIRLFEKSITISETDFELMEKQRKLGEDRRKFEIRPRFEFYGMTKTPERIQLDLINKGAIAKIIASENLEGNSLSNTINKLIDKEISKNEKLTMKFLPLSGFITDECYVKVKIVYEDIDKNKYYQIIEGRGDLVLKIEKQVEIE